MFGSFNKFTTILKETPKKIGQEIQQRIPRRIQRGIQNGFIELQNGLNEIQGQLQGLQEVLQPTPVPTNVPVVLDEILKGFKEVSAIFLKSVLEDYVERGNDKNLYDRLMVLNAEEKITFCKVLKEYKDTKPHAPRVIVLDGLMHYYGINIPQNHKMAKSYYKMASEKGKNAEAQTRLGIIHLANGEYAEAQEFFEMAQENGDALNGLGHLCLRKKPVPDLKAAREFFHRGAVKGSLNALSNLGILSKEEKNYTEAWQCFNEGTKQGNFLALNSLGSMYLEIEKDYAAALKCYQCGADRGCNWSLFYLANMYFKGNGVDRDYNKGIGLLLKAAQARWDKALFKAIFVTLGEIYGLANNITKVSIFKRLANKVNDLTRRDWERLVAAVSAECNHDPIALHYHEIILMKDKTRLKALLQDKRCYPDKHQYFIENFLGYDNNKNLTAATAESWLYKTLRELLAEKDFIISENVRTNLSQAMNPSLPQQEEAGQPDSLRVGCGPL